MTWSVGHSEHGKHLGPDREFNSKQFMEMMKGELWRVSRRELNNVLCVSGDDNFRSIILMLKLFESSTRDSLAKHEGELADIKKKLADIQSLMQPGAGSRQLCNTQAHTAGAQQAAGGVGGASEGAHLFWMLGESAKDVGGGVRSAELSRGGEEGETAAVSKTSFLSPLELPSFLAGMSPLPTDMNPVSGNARSAADHVTPVAPGAQQAPARSSSRPASTLSQNDIVMAPKRRQRGRSNDVFAIPKAKGRTTSLGATPEMVSEDVQVRRKLSQFKSMYEEGLITSDVYRQLQIELIQGKEIIERSSDHSPIPSSGAREEVGRTSLHALPNGWHIPGVAA